jgi:hypothetical protein
VSGPHPSPQPRHDHNDPARTITHPTRGEGSPVRAKRLQRVTYNRTSRPLRSFNARPGQTLQPTTSRERRTADGGRRTPDAPEFRDTLGGHGSRLAPVAADSGPVAGRGTHRIVTFRAQHPSAPESGLGAGRETQRIATFRAPRPVGTACPATHPTCARRVPLPGRCGRANGSTPPEVARGCGLVSSQQSPGQRTEHQPSPDSRTAQRPDGRTASGSRHPSSRRRHQRTRPGVRPRAAGR